MYYDITIQMRRFARSNSIRNSIINKANNNKSIELMKTKEKLKYVELIVLEEKKNKAILEEAKNVFTIKEKLSAAELEFSKESFKNIQLTKKLNEEMSYTGLISVFLTISLALLISTPRR